MIQIYISKTQLFKYALIALVFVLIGIFFILKNEDVALGYASVIFFSFCLIILLTTSNLQKPYITLTPTYIKIKNFENLLWSDITQVVDLPRNAGIAFQIKDSTKYKLTKLQKLNDRLSATPFWIGTQLISKKDKQILLEYISKQLSEQKD